jgi:exopolyphosphatase/guanosine-5'-triphosphate,3'-diphosphate pyrophosphatase
MAEKMSEVIPRWEWRSFGQRFGDAERLLARFTPSDVQESDEIYLISDADSNVKIRDSLMDVKVRRDLNADGVEQWTPVLKAAFPLSPEDIAVVFRALDVPPADDLQSGCSLNELLQHLSRPGSKVRVVKVHKRRIKYSVDNCMAELSDVVANGMKTRTLAVESTDPVLVMQAVTALGMRDYLNTSYPRGLSALLDGEAERYAAVDVGTNSVKFHIGTRGSDGIWRTVIDRAEVTRLGEGLPETGMVSDAALERTAVAIAGMTEEARRYGVRAMAAVGTAGLRIASNAAEVIAAIKARSGVRIEVISGEEESRLAFLATTAGLGLKTGSMVVFDTGGGSSQFTFARGSVVDERFSVEVGAVQYTERFGLDGVVDDGVVNEALKAIAADLSCLAGRQVPDTLVGMGGAVTNMTAVKHGLKSYDATIVHGTILDRTEIEGQIRLYRSLDAKRRRAITGIQPKRAEVILAGACIVRTIMEMLGKNSLTVSDRGLRHGLLAERFEAGEQQKPSGTIPSGKTKKNTSRSREEKKAMVTADVETKPNSPAPTFSNEDVTKILELIKGSKSVELKLTVPDESHRAAIKGLGFDPVETQPRQAYFFDTPDLALIKAGVVVRARRIQGGDGDTVIKLRPIDPSMIDRELRRSDSFKIELDAMPGGYVCSASYKGACTAQEVLDVAAGTASIASLFSREQRAFYKKHAPADIKLDSLSVLGPTFLLKARHQPKDFDRRITVELWLYPDGSRIFEISTKCTPKEAFQAAAEFKAHLVKCGIELTAAQSTKTKSALEFFGAELRKGK